MGFERDPTLYSGSARFYLEGWLAYAPSMADTPVRTLGLDGTGRLLDVGCGPGIVALDLASLFEVTVGTERSPSGGLVFADDLVERRVRRKRRRSTWEARVRDRGSERVL
jgi:methylase of polypeptide subunit release factors